VSVSHVKGHVRHMGMLSSHADQQDMSLASAMEPLLHGEIRVGRWDRGGDDIPASLV
jgi:hypothetical protein